MRIIIPMAGMGKRMRPHTLTTPKPLLSVAGKPIVQRLVEDIAGTFEDTIEEIAFIIGDFGKAVEEKLIGIAESLGAKGSIYYQKEALGTAHAILCAADSLEGNVVVAFADTLFKTNFKMDTNKDGIIWVQKIDDPSAFGVVKVNDDNVITDFVEKPTEFVSDLAIIGVYYFKDGGYLKDELQYLIDNNIKDKGEYQLTNALENMKQKGSQFAPGTVEEWLDCGNKDATVYTNQRILELKKDTEDLVDKSMVNQNSQIIEPCFIGKGVTLVNSVVGPHVSIGDNTTVENSVINNVIIQTNTHVRNAVLSNSMLGNDVKLNKNSLELSIGDFSTIND